ncbi:type II toxin-antitoxin system SpoIISB family antitoxin [Cytobacillus firmus]|uniref:type II toxin-antitoxin system SpoIISB family antitoxin n=1 Tax=Cytobacillus firmus TaxID=1399 RepID=UPI001C8DD01D|nr:type II toxin-antitoxin system SpoIISB family antitoxin [Cytobacillus firmus]MBX9974050.1 type II toxin-antitoxin system SpoIISB family antitoxin [Cytobacillus firmus]MDM5225411.1 type II toxin-antitoxin system SpoIISB family antitoxin [Cytobacillus sp. NJ13]
MKEPADNEKQRLSTKNNMKIMKKKSRIRLPDFEVSPHTERIIKENKRLISVYTKSKA